MKNAFKLSGLFVFSYVALAAEWQAGNGAIQLETSLTGVYDSNIRASANAVGDYHFSFDPVLRYRDNSARFQTDASASLRVRRYLDHPGSDSTDPVLTFDWQMARADGHSTGAHLQLGYVESNDAVLEVNQQVKTKNFSSQVSGEVLVAERNLLTAGVAVRDYERSFGSDRITRSGNLGYSYVGFTDGTVVGVAYTKSTNETMHSTLDTPALDQKTDTILMTVKRPIYDQLAAMASYGYRWLDRGVQEQNVGLADVSGPVYNLSLDGPFLPRKYFPKTTGTFRVAYEQSDAPGLNDRSTRRLVGEIDVGWAARENTNVHVFTNRAQDLSITDNTVVSLNSGISVSQAIGTFVHSSLGFTYTNADFVNLGRTDERYLFHAEASYRINRTWSSSLSYSYLHSVSSQAIGNYNRHIVSLTLTYAF